MLLAAILHRTLLCCLRPLLHGLLTQFADRLNGQRLDFIRRAKVPVRAGLAGNGEDGFKLRQQFRTLPESLVEFLHSLLLARFLGGGLWEFFVVVFWFHRHVHLDKSSQSTI